MKLEIFLSGCETEQKIKIGAEDGVSFYYGGTVGNLLEKQTQYAAALRKHSADCVKRAKERLRAEVTRSVTPEAFLTRELREKHPAISFNDYRAWLSHHFDVVASRKQLFEEQQEKHSHFVELMERQVVSKKKAETTVDEDTLIVITEGSEHGTLWMLNEITEPGLCLQSADEEENEEE